MNEVIRIFARPEVFTMVKDGNGQIAEFHIKGYNKNPYRDGNITVPAFGVKGIHPKIIKNSQNYEGWLMIEASKDVTFLAQEHVIVDGFDVFNGGRIQPDDLKSFVNSQNNKIKQVKLDKSKNEFAR